LISLFSVSHFHVLNYKTLHSCFRSFEKAHWSHFYPLTFPNLKIVFTFFPTLSITQDKFCGRWKKPLNMLRFQKKRSIPIYARMIKVFLLLLIMILEIFLWKMTFLILTFSSVSSNLKSNQNIKIKVLKIYVVMFKKSLCLGCLSNIIAFVLNHNLYIYFQFSQKHY